MVTGLFLSSEHCGLLAQLTAHRSGSQQTRHNMIGKKIELAPFVASRNPTGSESVTSQCGEVGESIHPLKYPRQIIYCSRLTLALHQVQDFCVQNSV
jgi:hypothetical protein